MVTTAERHRTWRFPRMLLHGHVTFASIWWAGLVLACLCLAAVLARFAEVPGSIWEQAQSKNLSSWYIAGVGGYVAYQTVPMYIAHGRIRKDTTIEGAIFIVAFSAAAAILITVGYLIEYVVYGMAGWPRALSGDRLFTSSLDVPMIVAQYWLTFIVWGMAGALVGAACYRYGLIGCLAGIPAVILIGLADIFTRTPWEPIQNLIEPIASVERASLTFTTLTCVACFLAALTLMWPILRDLPIRNR